MKLKTSELTGRALDYAVAKAQGLNVINFGGAIIHREADGDQLYKPTDYWHLCGQLIDTFGMELTNELVNDVWIYYATCPHLMGEYQHGDTPRIAICHAVVAAELGNEVEIPDELLEGE
ncbi:DUF2591 domain-containing protein [Xenorhabdus sp. 12]|uniref:DUF2591 domain-containing protein n=1 Tax=Xenorhabdus santafensis TaxID=2582833 RepID=A0ABU4SED3_9GAMM|nr:phage protein NinX family protein [Xenorhabdus sp. 12]MDX7989165.1 DUF2591 domain-containing protein [Xenorhabdus sp. 12]